MKLEELLGEKNLRAAVEELLEPATVRPPKEKGADAIKVRGYFVHGHWRCRWIPVKRKLRLITVNGNRQRA